LVPLPERVHPMAGHRLQLPTIQNWSCHNCSGCCRQHLIEVSDEERRRILDQHWEQDTELADQSPVLVKLNHLPGSRRYRLAHQADGACIFLDENGLCRIHAKFGEEAKPLACRIYPYAFHPAGRNLAVSLRFSCPSVVSNRGGAVRDQTDEIKKLARDAVPAGVSRLPAPEITPGEQLDWPDFLRLRDALDAELADNEAVNVKLRRALFWINLIEQATFSKVRGDRLDDFLDLLRQTAGTETLREINPSAQPSRSGRMQFRMLTAQYARKDTFADQQSSWRGRWKLLRAAVRFARGTGTVPPLQDLFQEVPFAELEHPFGGLPAQAEEIFTRYLRVKIQGLHFCGRAYYGVPLVEGFRSLVLVYPCVMWLSRWLALGRGRSVLQTDDVADALAIADHHHGYSPAFGRRDFRRRVRSLARLGDIEKLCVWYSR